jgi:4-amino-4-deoxy-L-arabinose transferase
MDDYIHPWDERYHALVAKNLMSDFSEPTLYKYPLLNHENTDWRYCHIWLHKQPLPLWSISASLYMFGLDDFFVRLPSLLLSTLSLLITFLIGKNLFNDKVGLMACFFQAINGFIIELTSGRIATDHVDVFYMFFIQLAIWFVVKFYKSRNSLFVVLTGFSIGLAVLCKWLPALMVIPLFMLLGKNVLEKKVIFKYAIIIFSCCVLVCLPWQLFIAFYYPKQSAM